MAWQPNKRLKILARESSYGFVQTASLIIMHLSFETLTPTGPGNRGVEGL